MADGKRQGFPILLKHSLGDVTPIGFTPAGSYYYAYGRMLNDVFTARLDLGTDKVLSEPVPVRQTGLEKELIRIDPPARLTGSALSPDGQRLVLSVTPSQAGVDGPVVKIISTAGGPPRELLHFEKSEKAGVLSVAWMPDSRDVLFYKHLGAGKEHELWRISAEGGEPRRLWSRKTIGRLRVHPDGQHIAFYDRSTPHGVWVMENFLPGGVARSSK